MPAPVMVSATYYFISCCVIKELHICLALASFILKCHKKVIYDKAFSSSSACKKRKRKEKREFFLLKRMNDLTL
jgi:hypothetical protein